jgi:hypothetical protein
MTGFFDRLLGKKAAEERGKEISLDEVSAIIGERRRVAEEELAVQAAASRARLLELTGHLQNLLRDLAAGEAEEKRPPRLEKVVKTSIPSFCGTMETILSHPLPEEPEALYEETAARVKKIVRAMRGQGKYIASMLPEEMKEIRITVDGMGGELNALTRTYGKLKEARGEVGKVERAAGAVRGLLEEQRGLAAREEAIREDLEGLRAEKIGLEKRIQRREGDPGYLELLSAEEELEALQKEAEERSSSCRITASTAASLLKRAEHEIGEEEVKRAIRKLRETLDRGEMEEIERVLPELAQWEEVMAAMAGEGKLAPKNRAEREILAGERRLAEEFAHIAAGSRELERRREEKHMHLSTSSLRREMQEDRERLDAVLAGIAGAEDGLERVKERVSALEEALPRRLESLDEQMTEFEGRQVHVIVQTG